MKQNSVGEMIFNEDDVCDLLMQGRTVDSLKNILPYIRFVLFFLFINSSSSSFKLANYSIFFLFYNINLISALYLISCINKSFNL